MTYIVRFKNQIFCFYYDIKNKNIILKKNIDNKWSEPAIIFREACPEFTINIYDNTINLFCQNNLGNIFLCSYQDYKNNNKNNIWQNKMILQSQFNYPLLIYPLFNNQNYSLLYNIPVDKNHKNNFYLVINQFKQNRWQPSNQIDKIYNLENFSVQRINNNHLLTFYITQTNQTNLGYREITSNQQSNFNLIHSTYYKITDSSFLTTNNSIHVLYTVKNLFTKQIIYRSKQANYFSKPIILFENPNIDNNLLLIIKNDLYAFWTINDKIYTAISKDNGFTFENPIKYNEKFDRLKKAIYLTDKNMQEKDFFAREIFIESENPTEIKFLDALSIFNKNNKTKNKNILAQKNIYSQNNLETNSEIINKLKNQIDIKNKQLEQKNKQIYNLTDLLKSKNQEIILLASHKKNNQNQIKSNLDKPK